jgi:PEP-CTERM motif-containing protein
VGHRVGYVKRGSVRRVRRHRHSRRTIVFFAFPLLLGLIVSFAAWLLSRHSHQMTTHAAQLLDPEWARGNASQNLAMLAGQVHVPIQARTEGVVYPYSVVPGGVRSPEELQAIAAHDHLVAKHYSGFDFRRAKIIELRRPTMMYLSYRMGEKIFWTKKQIGLRQGEKLITDGKMTARTRCANRVEALPQAAISPQEPLAEQFDDPFAEGGSARKFDFPGNFESALDHRIGPTGFGGDGPPQSPIAGGFGPGGGFPGVFPPPLPGGLGTCTPTKPKHGHPAIEAGSSSKKKRNPCAPGPPATVPEPGTILLVASGAAGIYWRHRSATACK